MFGKKKIPHLNGPGNFDLEIVGESHYQDSLKRITHGRSDVRHECTAELYLEPNNKYDPNAVRVDIDGKIVGYLSRDMATEMRRSLATAGLNKAGQRVTINAVIVGGGDKFYGVWLDMEVLDDEDEDYE